MALIVADRVKQESTTTGTGTFTLAGGVDGFQNFSDVCSTNDTMYYVIQEKIGTDFEVGHGTFNSSGQLERTNILQSSNNDNAVNFGAGTKDVFITYPADKAVYQNYDGSITIPSTIDGRDLANDGSKLDGIEASATADQTAAEIRTLVESATDSNVFTDADHTKLNGIEASATADQTGAEIKSAYEGEADTNAFTDALLTKLNGIETAADVTDATNVNAAGAIMNSDVATKGQIIVGDGSGDPTILSVGTDGHYLKADSSAGSGVAWASIPAGVGGANGVDFNDNVKARFGTGNDLEIYHDGNDSYIKDSSGTGDLLIQTNKLEIVKADAFDRMATFTGDGSVQLRYDDAIVFETSTGGIDIPDNKKLQFGAGQDLQIYHDGNDSYVRDAGTGNLRLEGNDVRVANANSTADYIRCTNGGAVDLLHNNTKMFSTTSQGVQVEADKRLDIVNGSNWSGEVACKLENHSNNLYIQYTTNCNIRNSSGTDTFVVNSNGNVTATGNVTAYSDNRLKENIKTIDNALDKVSKLRGVEYTRKETKAREIGVIAQEVKEIVPELITIENTKSDINPEGLEDLHTMKYANTVGLLIEAIKELKAEIETLKKKCECCK